MKETTFRSSFCSRGRSDGLLALEDSLTASRLTEWIASAGRAFQAVENSPCRASGWKRGSR